MSKRRTIIKWILIVSGICLFTYAGFMVCMFLAFTSAFGPSHTTQELIDNYNKRQTNLLELKRYFNSIVPKGKQVEIEFESDRKLARFGVSTVDSLRGQRSVAPIFLEWDLSTTSAMTKVRLEELGWTQQTLRTIKEKLDDADCIQIESGEPTKIGWQRSGMGMFFYNVFDHPIADSLVKFYNADCAYMIYSPNLVLEWGGGAVGPQCFPRN